MKKILLLAQTPPPFHGQSIMQQYLVQDKWSWCLKEHIRMEYSDSIKEVGHFHYSKVTKLFKLIFNVWRSGNRKSIDLLYYPPAGPQRIPLYRDILTLLFCKLISRRIILHFHAGGLSELIHQLSSVERFFAKLAFKNVDHAIVLLPWLEKETKWFSPKNIHVVPNGIEDVANRYPRTAMKGNDTTSILFTGNLKDEKGIFILLEAARLLSASNNNFLVSIMGEAHSQEVKEKIVAFIEAHHLNDRVKLLGSLSGDNKWNAFANADIFCLPTYATEAMPVSILEAMMFALPTVTTQWRAIPDMIADGHEGLLVPVKDPVMLAEKLALLINNPELATKMGRESRIKYERYFRIEKHLQKMEEVFKSSFAVTADRAE